MMRNEACVLVAAVLVTLGVIGCSTAAPKPTQPTARASASPGATAIADCTSGLLGAVFEGGSQPGAGQALGFVFLWDKLASVCALVGPVTITGLSRAGRQVTPAVRFTLPPFTSARLTPDGTKPDMQGRIPWTAPGNLEALTCRIRLCYQGILLRVVPFLEFFRRAIIAGRVEPLIVVPGDPFHRGEGDIPDTVPRSFPVDELFLVEAVH
jgi:hypothetical protein